jgi:hypothetical protein
MGAEQRLDLLAAEIGISVRVEQALLAGQQGALAVDVNGAAFEHQGHRATRQVQMLQYGAGDRRVLVVGLIPAAPAVEAPIDAFDAASAVDDEARAGIAGPGIVVGHGQAGDARTAFERRLGDVVGIGDHGDGLEAGDGARDLGVGLLRRP